MGHDEDSVLDDETLEIEGLRILRDQCDDPLHIRDEGLLKPFSQLHRLYEQQHGPVLNVPLGPLYVMRRTPGLLNALLTAPETAMSIYVAEKQKTFEDFLFEHSVLLNNFVCSELLPQAREDPRAQYPIVWARVLASLTMSFSQYVAWSDHPYTRTFLANQKAMLHFADVVMSSNLDPIAMDFLVEFFPAPYPR